MQDFPTTIRELRHACLPSVIEMHPRSLWTRFESFFSSHGYTLWSIVPVDIAAFTAPDSRTRAPDAFLQLWREPKSLETYFTHQYPVLCPARTIDGRDVMIRVIAIGEDGIEHQRALERVASGLTAFVAGNHCAPVLQWLTLEDVTFAVFPMLGIMEPSYSAAFENVRDFLATVEQLFEAVAFCHERLVAHRDLFMGNILTNVTGGWPAEINIGPDQSSHVQFRSKFLYKLYLIDFELAVCFDKDSDPSTHTVIGCPVGDRTRYARDMAPEMKSDEPHSPFAADIWQLALYIYDMPIRVFPPNFQRLIEKMLNLNPHVRPNAQEALHELRKLIAEMGESELRAAVEYAPVYCRRKPAIVNDEE